MKYLWIGILILALLLTSSVLSGMLVCAATRQPLLQLNAALDAFDGSGLAEAKPFASAANASWRRHSRHLSALLGHAELDEIEALFSSLESYAVTESEAEFRSACAELSLRLSHIAQMDIPYYYNFFARVIGT